MKVQSMHRSISDYELLPRVIRKGVLTDFTLRGLGMDTKFEAGVEYLLRFIPHEQNNSPIAQTLSRHWLYEGITAVADEDGYIRFSHKLDREETYTIRVSKADDEKRTLITNLRLFVAEDDLWSRTPMKGNTHCHVCVSVDGEEDPARVAAMHRKAGYDYLAITDHHLIGGSLIAIDRLKDIPHGISLYKGEEVHVPDPYIHAVNVGADLGGIGVNTYYDNNKEKCDAEVQAIAESLNADELPEDVLPIDVAWRTWIAKMIHDHGGIAIAAHPFWIWEAHNTRNAMLRYMAEHKLFDAMEVLGGQHPGSMEANMQISFWNDMRADGIHMPIVGADDAHIRHTVWSDSDCFNKVYTVAFMNDPSFEGFKDAILNRWTVAVDQYDEATPHIVGTYRLTRFLVFLLEQYFPIHDELCFAEGQLIGDACIGDESAFALLPAVCNRVKEFEKKFFGR